MEEPQESIVVTNFIHYNPTRSIVQQLSNKPCSTLLGWGYGSDKTNRHTLPYLCIGEERYTQLIYKIYSVSEKDRH